MATTSQCNITIRPHCALVVNTRQVTGGSVVIAPRLVGLSLSDAKFPSPRNTKRCRTRRLLMRHPCQYHLED
ncbi:unnamed protein product [Ixodes pacificus]